MFRQQSVRIHTALAALFGFHRVTPMAYRNAVRDRTRRGSRELPSARRAAAAAAPHTRRGAARAEPCPTPEPRVFPVPMTDRPVGIARRLDLGSDLGSKMAGSRVGGAATVHTVAAPCPVSTNYQHAFFSSEVSRRRSFPISVPISISCESWLSSHQPAAEQTSAAERTVRTPHISRHTSAGSAVDSCRHGDSLRPRSCCTYLLFGQLRYRRGCGAQHHGHHPVG